MATERLMEQLSLKSVADDREGGHVINLLYPIGDPQKVWDDAEADLEKKKLLVLGHPALPWKDLPMNVKKIIVGKLAPVPAFTSTPRDDIYRQQRRMLEAEVADHIQDWGPLIAGPLCSDPGAKVFGSMGAKLACFPMRRCSISQNDVLPQPRLPTMQRAMPTFLLGCWKI